MTLIKSVLDVSFCKILTEISNGMHGTMKRKFCRFRDSDMVQYDMFGWSTYQYKTKDGVITSYCGWCVFIDQMFLLRSTLQTNDVRTQIH